MYFISVVRVWRENIYLDHQLYWPETRVKTGRWKVLICRRLYVLTGSAMRAHDACAWLVLIFLFCFSCTRRSVFVMGWWPWDRVARERPSALTCWWRPCHSVDCRTRSSGWTQRSVKWEETNNKCGEVFSKIYIFGCYEEQEFQQAIPLMSPSWDKNCWNEDSSHSLILISLI